MTILDYLEDWQITSIQKLISKMKMNDAKINYYFTK